MALYRPSRLISIIKLISILIVFFLEKQKLFIMKHDIVTAFAILLAMGVVVQKGDSFIRAGREMIYKKEGDPQQPVEYYYERVAVPPPSALFKKGWKVFTPKTVVGGSVPKVTVTRTMCTLNSSAGRNLYCTFPGLS